MREILFHFPNLRFYSREEVILTIMNSNAWCSIQYYEELQKIGSPFIGYNNERTIVVDSGVYPQDGSIKNRFCLGIVEVVQHTVCL